MPTYSWLNARDGRRLDVRCRIEDRDIPPGEEDGWVRLQASPMVLQASYLDGQRAKSDEGYAKIREAARLRVVAADIPNNTEDKRRINKEIDTLEKAKR